MRSADLIRRLSAPTETRARLFDDKGAMLADSLTLASPRGLVRIEELPTDKPWYERSDELLGWFDDLINWSPGQRDLPLYRELDFQSASDYEEVGRALVGQTYGAMRIDSENEMILSVAVPVQRFRQVVGAVMLSTDAQKIEQGMRDVRLGILRVFSIALAATALLSLYLAGTIARPLSGLPPPPNGSGMRGGRTIEIPDLTHRGDEIGDLSQNMRDMTEALWRRLDAIENFGRRCRP